MICIGQATVSFAEFLELMGEILTETTRWGNLGTKLEGYVGFDTIQEQIRKKSLKRGFEFNLMVVGRAMKREREREGEGGREGGGGRKSFKIIYEVHKCIVAIYIIM